MKATIASLSLTATTVLAASRTSAPAGCITVSQSGNGDHSTVQAAVDSLDESSSDAQCIFIESGTYTEQVLVSARSASQFNVYGYTEDDTSFTSNTVTIVFNLSQNDGLNNDETGTLRVKTPNFRLYNVNVENSYGEGSQAIALSAQSDSGFYGSLFRGFQDTVLANEGHQVYLDSQIIGATDFIFGQRAMAWFERCDIRCVERSIGYVTAHGRDEENDSFYAFDYCTVSGENDSGIAGSYYLGRPWREYARVVFQRTEMSDVINDDGWSMWNGEGDVSNVYYGEYENTGSGAEGDRVDWAVSMSAPVTMSEVLGSYESAGWFDASYYAGNGADVGDS